MFEDSVYVGRNCPFCGKYHEVEVSEADYWSWLIHEKSVQTAFPYLNANDREILVSGICSECWDNMFGED